MFKQAKVIKHIITLSFECNGVQHSVKLTNFYISEYQAYADEHYKVITFICPICGEEHTFAL